ncbi:MAG: hypothetical protein JWQ10_368 [Herbaspirillum sp.]|nr:hypothetical protein [Herbaspirillum sp.]
MSDDYSDMHTFDLELSDRETFFIGHIIAQWGALEHEIFIQTLKTFDRTEDEELVLPSQMNNLSFTSVLAIWKTRVADQAEGKRGAVLLEEYQKIIELHEHRNALVHGMWDWSKSDPTKISIVRIRKKEIITVHFTADDLQDFSLRVAKINFKLRYPGGVEDLVTDRIEQGFYISRRGLSLFTDTPVAADFFPALKAVKEEPKSS